MSFNPLNWLGGGRQRAAVPPAAAEPAAGAQALMLAAIDRAFAVIEFNTDGTILQVNDPYLAMVGYSRAELLGKPYGMLLDPVLRDSPEFRQSWAGISLGHAGRSDCRLAGKGGKEVWVSANWCPVKNALGQPLKVVQWATDISAQHRREQDAARRIASLESANRQPAAPSDAYAVPFQTTERELRSVVSAVIDGNLQARLTLSVQPPFFAMLSHQINSLIDSFAGVVGSVKGTADEVARGVQEISQGNVDLSERTEAQASSLEQTASSMEQMTSSVRQNADNSRQANQLAVAARDQADKGGAVVAKAVKAMSEINASSKKISDIIGVIDEIAFQTNLLALNAAVEAARAGEQGRGFAVVASEVRNLAGRSALAAKEIKGLISDSVHKVEEGSALVAQSGQTLEQIVSAVKKVSDIIAEIAASSQEQSTGIDQVNKAVVQLDEMTQQNAALVEQATAASQSIAEQSQALSDVMSKYSVSGPAGAPVRAPAGAAAKASAAARPERRTASRAWAAPKSTPKTAHRGTAPAAARQPKAAKTGTSDSEWAQF